MKRDMVQNMNLSIASVRFLEYADKNIELNTTLLLPKDHAITRELPLTSPSGFTTSDQLRGKYNVERQEGRVLYKSSPFARQRRIT
jgi:hypothetical protein